MLVEVATLLADNRRTAEDTSLLQRWWCDVLNTALRWPTRRYINGRVHWCPDDVSFPERIGQLEYLSIQRDPQKSEVEEPLTREHYSSNSSSYITSQPTHSRSTDLLIHTQEQSYCTLASTWTCPNISISLPFLENAVKLGNETSWW